MIEILDSNDRLIAEAETPEAAKAAAEYLISSGEEPGPLFLVRPEEGPLSTDPRARREPTSVSGVAWRIPQGSWLP